MGSQLVLDFGTSQARIGVAGEVVPRFVATDEAAAAGCCWESRLIDLERFDWLLTTALQEQLKLKEDSTSIVDKVLVCESVQEFDSHHFRRRVRELLEEVHKVKHVQFELAPVLALYSRGITHAVAGIRVLDMGAGSCRLSTVVNCSKHGGLKVATTSQLAGLGGNEMDNSNSTSSFPHCLAAIAKHRAKRESEFVLPDGTPVLAAMSEELALLPSDQVVVVCGGVSRTPGLKDKALLITPSPRRAGGGGVVTVVPAAQADVAVWIGGSLALYAANQ